MAGRDTVDSTRQDLYQWLDNVGQVYVKEGVSNVCWPGREGGWVICWANYREYLIIYDNAPASIFAAGNQQPDICTWWFHGFCCCL